MTLEQLTIKSETAKTANGTVIGGILVKLGSQKSQKGNYTHTLTCPGKMLTFSTQDVPRWLIPLDGEVVQSVTLDCQVTDSANGSWINKQVKILSVASVIDASGKVIMPKL